MLGNSGILKFYLDIFNQSNRCKGDVAFWDVACSEESKPVKD